MGSVIPLRNHHDSDEKEQLKNNNDFAESLFFDAEETDNSSDTDSKEEEQSLVNLKREIKLAKEALSILLNTHVEEDTEAFIKWSEDVQKAKEHYRNLMKLFNEDIDADEEIEKQISELETLALLLYTPYEKSNPFIEDAAEGEEPIEITDNTSESDLVSSVETKLTTQPTQGSYVQPQPNTPIKLILISIMVS